MNIVILTPLKVEYEAVRSHLSNCQSVNYQRYNYEIGQYQQRNTIQKVAICETGSRNTVVALAAENAIKNFKPQIILLVGVAGGIKDVTIGDIVVGTRAYDYGAGKETETGHLARPKSFTFNADLINIAKRLLQGKENRAGIIVDGQIVKVLFGPISSRDIVLTSRQSPAFQVIHRYYNDTKAIEMESMGFAEAVANYDNIKALNIRGISDLIEGKTESDKKGYQEIAAKRAAAFAFELLRQIDTTSFYKETQDLSPKKKHKFIGLGLGVLGIILFFLWQQNFVQNPSFGSSEAIVDKTLPLPTVTKKAKIVAYDSLKTATSTADKPPNSKPKKTVNRIAQNKTVEQNLCFKIIDESGLPVTEATVTIRELKFLSEITNKEGVVCFSNVPVKKIKVKVVKFPLFVMWEREFNVTLDDTDNTFEIKLERQSEEQLIFYGIISNEAQLPVSEVNVQLQLGALLKTIKTDENGYYMIKIANQKRFTKYTLQIRHVDYNIPLKTNKQLVKNGIEYENDFVLKPKKPKKQVPVNVKKSPAIIIVYDDYEQIVPNAKVYLGDSLLGSAGKTFYFAIGSHTVEVRWKDKIYKEVIHIEKGKPIPKLLISTNHFD